jgi:hypothetical protein
MGVNIWQFLDKQIDRVRPSGVAGAGIFILTGIVLWMLSKDRTLADNDLFKTLAQAIVVQGLVGLAMAAWFTKGEAKVRIDQPADDPVPVSPTDEGEVR